MTFLMVQRLWCGTMNKTHERVGGTRSSDCKEKATHYSQKSKSKEVVCPKSISTSCSDKCNEDYSIMIIVLAWIICVIIILVVFMYKYYMCGLK